MPVADATRRVLAVLAAALAGAALAATPAPARALPGLRTGFSDASAYQNAAVDRAAAIAHTRAARGSVVRVLVSWSDVAPERPPEDRFARDPAWPGYRWAALDPVVRDLGAAGLRPLLSITAAPAWAEGAGRPAVSDDVPAGSWRPSPEAFALFAAAAAARYAGTFPDPERPGAALPRVRDWQAWNEPNLSNFLTPQWARDARGHLTPASPALYRALLGAFYRGVKSVHRDNLVVTGGTAPYGEPYRGGRRMAPALFVRELLCVRGRARPVAARCPGGPARFDALAHHPYPIGPPGRHAINADDVVVPDLDKLTRPLAVALRAGNVAPRTPKQLWATEISWDSSPPDPDGIPEGLHARYVAGALYVLWRQGVDVVTWWQLRDSAIGPGYPFTLQSGVFFRGATVAQDTAKPAFTAFRFPFTAYRGGSRSRLWGIAPAAGSVRIERLAPGGAWRTVRRVRAGASRVFLDELPTTRGTRLRAVQGDERSLAWRVD